MSPTRYRFGPLERRGLVAGWRGGQIAAVAVGLVVAVGVLRASASPAGVVMALAAVAVGVGVATWPIVGRTAEEWAPDALRHALRRRPRPWRSGPFAGVDLIAVDVGVSTAGVLWDRARRTYTAVLAASAPGFVLLGDDDKARRVGAWAGVLASLARDGSAVHRVQWIERTRPLVPAPVPGGAGAGPHGAALSAPGAAPVGGSAPTASMTAGVASSNGAGVRAASGLDADAAARASYEALLAAADYGARRHEVLLAVTVHGGRGARAVRAAGGGTAGACTVLLREVAALRRRLADASVDAGTVLAPAELSATVRAAFAPGGAAAPAEDGDRVATVPSASPEEGASASPATWPWPMGIAAEWGRLRADATWHATFWVSEWPRIDVGPDFLGPLVLSSDVRRAVSVVMEPLGPIAAARKVEQARTADIADAELRRRGGFLATARRRREEELLARRELELADGHAQYRFAGYVTVSAPDPDALEEACGRIEQSAGRAGLELRRCYGDQANAFTCALPLGRGLP